MLKYAIFGANGKMGQALISESYKFNNVAELKESFASPNFVKSEGKYSIFSKDSAKSLDFIIDFSTPKASLELAKSLAGTSILIMCGTTGFTESEMEILKKYSEKVKILYSANFSIGVNKFFKIIEFASNLLKEHEVEILEKHHNQKKDAPSGTALKIGQIVAKTKGLDFEKVKSFDRSKKRTPEEIGFACIRQGSIPGFHEVSFGNENERIWIGHEAFSKKNFAHDAILIAIKACTKVKNEKNGFFQVEKFIF